MLIIDKNSVYEIDEECMKKKKLSKEWNASGLPEGEIKKSGRKGNREKDI